MNNLASLVVQCIRICLAVQGTWVWSLVQEDPTCLRATKSWHHSYGASTLQPAEPTLESPSSTTRRRGQLKKALAKQQSTTAPKLNTSINLRKQIANKNPQHSTLNLCRMFCESLDRRELGENGYTYDIHTCICMIYVFMYICTYLICVHVYLYVPHTYMYVCTCVYVHDICDVYMYTHTCTCVRTLYMYTHMYPTHIHICIYIYTICIYMHIYVYTCVYDICIRYDWVPSLATWKYHNTVNWLYANTKFKSLI